MNKLALVIVGGVMLAGLSSCGRSEDANQPAAPDTVEMPADELPSGNPSMEAPPVDDSAMAPAGEASDAGDPAEAAAATADKARSAADAAKAAAAPATPAPGGN